MQRLLMLSLLIAGTTAHAQQTSSPDADASNVDVAVHPPSDESKAESPEAAVDDSWKPKLLIRLHAATNKVPLYGMSAGASEEVASVYCDNVAINVDSAGGGQSQYAVSCTMRAHVRAVGLQIDCDTLEIADGQLTMTNVRMMQQGQQITTEKLSMTLPVNGVTTTPFGKSLKVLNAVPYQGFDRRADRRDPDWSPAPEARTRVFQGDLEKLRGSDTGDRFDGSSSLKANKKEPLFGGDDFDSGR